VAAMDDGVWTGEIDIFEDTGPHGLGPPKPQNPKSYS